MLTIHSQFLPDKHKSDIQKAGKFHGILILVVDRLQSLQPYLEDPEQYDFVKSEIQRITSITQKFLIENPL